MHFVLPLPYNSRRADYQYSTRLPAAFHGCQQETYLNGLAQTHIVGNEPIGLVGSHNPMHQVNLVWQGIDIKAVQRPGNLIP